MLQQHQTQNWVAVGLAAFTLVVLTIALFLSWGSIETRWESQGGSMGGWNWPGASGQASEAYTFFEIEGHSWYEDRFDGVAGIQTIRVAIPVFLVGSVLVLAGAVASAVPPTAFDARRILSTGLLSGGALILLVGALLHLLGVFDLIAEVQGNGTDSAWVFEIGQVFVWLAVVLAVATVLVAAFWNPFGGEGEEGPAEVQPEPAPEPRPRSSFRPR